MSEERKPVWPWIVGVLIGLPVLYVASFGPACWACSRFDSDESLNWNAWHFLETCYLPFVCASTCSHARVRDAARWYACLMSSQPIHFFTGDDGRSHMVAGHLWSG
jgi:hypothetical protein